MGFPGQIVVTYTNGVLKPDKPLDLPEGARFRAVLSRAEVDPEAAAVALETIRRIRDSGAFRSGGRKFTREEMHDRDLDR